MHYFHRFKYKCEYEVNFIRGEDGEEVAYFTITKRYRTLQEPVDENSEIDVKVQEYEQGKSDFSLDSRIKLTLKTFRSHDTGTSSYSILTKPYCNSEDIVNFQNTEDKYCFFCCFSPIL